MSLAQLLLYSPRVLERLRGYVDKAGILAYVVPQVVDAGKWSCV